MANLWFPDAYHRIVEDSEDTEEFYRLAQRLIVTALVPLALGFYGLWFGYTSVKRVKRDRKNS